jgi:hypothetical protein
MSHIGTENSVVIPLVDKPATGFLSHLSEVATSMWRSRERSSIASMRASLFLMTQVLFRTLRDDAALRRISMF